MRQRSRLDTSRVFLVLCGPKGERDVSLLFAGCGDARSGHLKRWLVIMMDLFFIRRNVTVRFCLLCVQAFLRHTCRCLAATRQPL